MIHKDSREPDPQVVSDEELIRRYTIRRDKETAAELFLRYRHLVFGVCFNVLRDEEKAKDAVMGIFEKLLTNPPEQEIRHVKNWLYTISKNHCLLMLRREGTELRYRTSKTKELEREIMEFPGIGYPHDAREEEIARERLHQAVDGLKPEQRTCIILFYFEDNSYQEITDRTGYPYEKVKSYIQNGKRNLKNMLENGRKY